MAKALFIDDWKVKSEFACWVAGVFVIHYYAIHYYNIVVYCPNETEVNRFNAVASTCKVEKFLFGLTNVFNILVLFGWVFG